VVDVPSLSAYAQELPNVVHAEENLYTCSADTQQRIMEQIQEHRLNRVVVASCTPRTHRPLFMETLREAGLNPHLFEMANIRDQCSWVHADQPEQANTKARDLVSMAVARAAYLEPLFENTIAITRSALIIGGGIAGMTAALDIAREGYEAVIIEREPHPGGTLQEVKRLEDGTDTSQLLKGLEEEVRDHHGISILTNSSLGKTQGHIGRFVSTINTPDGTRDVEHGVTIVAAGASAINPQGLYGYGEDPRVLTQLELEKRLEQESGLDGAKSLTMIQCAGSRTEDNANCSRVCCTQAVKNALWIKSRFPEIDVTILYRDIRTYGMRELDYREARRKGVLFVRFDEENEPQVAFTDDSVKVTVDDSGLRQQLEFSNDLLVLSSGVRPHADASDLASALRVSLGQDGYFSEAHVKLRPLDFASDGIFLCGTAQGPKLVDETIAQARGAAARATSILAKEVLQVAAEFSVVDEDHCAGCLTCVRACPYGVPRITEDRFAYIEPAACQACGVCAAACPRKAIKVNGSTDLQIVAKLDALPVGKEMP
jgi:heterodisulfide reductase subunit A-like polyferredoxin